MAVPSFIPDALSDNILSLAGMEMENLSPLTVALIVKARDAACVAAFELCKAPPENADLVRYYQNEVRRFSELIKWMREIGESAALNEAYTDDDVKRIASEELFGIQSEFPDA